MEAQFSHMDAGRDHSAVCPELGSQLCGYHSLIQPCAQLALSAGPQGGGKHRRKTRTLPLTQALLNVVSQEKTLWGKRTPANASSPWVAVRGTRVRTSGPSSPHWAQDALPGFPPGAQDGSQGGVAGSSTSQLLSSGTNTFALRFFLNGVPSGVFISLSLDMAPS